ncbi:MAG: regulatory protein RecX [Clostridia bacterium]|nr:regulatory protein RecX [Clostridia bacterium]
MRIVEVRPRRKHYVAVLTDDGGEMLVDKRTWEESPYGVGSSLSVEQLEDLYQRSERDRAREKAVFLLSRRDYSRHELEQKLCREGGRFQADRREYAAEAAARMEELGYVNDEAYAQRLARQYQCERLYPRRRAVEKLCEKGVDRATAQQAVAQLDCEDAQLALEFLHKKRYNIPQSDEEAQKLMAALSRYGFAYEDIRRAIYAWQEEENHGN